MTTILAKCPLGASSGFASQMLRWTKPIARLDPTFVNERPLCARRGRSTTDKHSTICLSVATDSILCHSLSVIRTPARQNVSARLKHFWLFQRERPTRFAPSPIYRLAIVTSIQNCGAHVTPLVMRFNKYGDPNSERKLRCAKWIFNFSRPVMKTQPFDGGKLSFYSIDTWRIS